MHLIAITATESLGARLEDLLSSRFALQSFHDRLGSAEELSLALRYCVAGLSPKCAWRAYRAAQGVFCAIARVPLRCTRTPVTVGGAASGSRGGASEELELYMVDQNAWVYSAAVWAFEPKQGWWLNSVLDPSYDCEHGWWMGALMTPPVASKPTPASQERLSRGGQAGV